MALRWRGKQIEKLVDQAAMFGIDKTMSRASIHSKNNHPWRNRTTILEGSIRPVIDARKQGDRIVGVWGSVDVNYAIFLELGTSRMPAFPYLRPAADAEYPDLPKHIRSAYKKMSKKRSR